MISNPLLTIPVSQVKLHSGQVNVVQDLSRVEVQMHKQYLLKNTFFFLNIYFFAPNKAFAIHRDQGF